MAGIPAEDDRLVAAIKKLQDDVLSLQTRAGTVPMLSADPPADSGFRIWLLDDGRLRGRKATGEIVEWAFSNHLHDDRYAKLSSPGPGGGTGGGGSTEPPPVPPYVPSTRVYESDADWSQAYMRGGGQPYTYGGANLYYGYNVASNGELKSMIHFPGLASALAPGPAGTSIAEVWLRLSNIHTYGNGGADLRIGFHNNDTKPGSFAEGGEVGRIHVGKPSYDQWYRLTEGVGNGGRDGWLKGLTLNQNSTSRAGYGYAGGVGSAVSPPRLKIIYVK